MKVAITGKTEPLLAGRTASLLLRPRGTSDPMTEQEKLQKDALRAFIDHVALSAHGAARAAGARHVAHVILRDGAGRPELEPISQADARAYLIALVAEMFTGVHDYLLPCEAVFAQNVRGTDLDDAVDTLLSTPRRKFSSSYGPVKELERFDVPTAAVASGMVGVRFQPYFGLQKVGW
jgi:hypothetical protein